MDYVRELAHRLRGTTDSAEGIIERMAWEDKLPADWEISLYKLVDRCGFCDWVFDRNELLDDDEYSNNGLICRECLDENRRKAAELNPTADNEDV